MKKSIVLTMLLVALCAVGCKNKECEKTVEVTEWHLPKVINDYLPYEVGQQFMLANTSDTLFFKVDGVHLLDYDTACYTYSYNPCYPEGLSPSYSVSLACLPETNVDRYRDQSIIIGFGGFGGGEDGQQISVEFFMDIRGVYNDIITSKRYEGDVAELGDTIVIKGPSLTAELVKNRGLVSFLDNYYNTTAWVLTEE